MFLLSQISEEVRVAPSELARTPLDAVTAVLRARFVDKVVPNLGLVVTLYDVLSLDGGTVYPNDGAAFFQVRPLRACALCACVRAYACVACARACAYACACLLVHGRVRLCACVCLCMHACA